MDVDFVAKRSIDAEVEYNKYSKLSRLFLWPSDQLLIDLFVILFKKESKLSSKPNRKAKRTKAPPSTREAVTVHTWTRSTGSTSSPSNYAPSNASKHVNYWSHFRNVLDFDFEKLCSVTLSNNNVYACLVCGKYYQGIHSVKSICSSVEFSDIVLFSLEKRSRPQVTRVHP